MYVCIYAYTYLLKYSYNNKNLTCFWERVTSISIEVIRDHSKL
jgi:hypothetical protein